LTSRSLDTSIPSWISFRPVNFRVWVVFAGKACVKSRSAKNPQHISRIRDMTEKVAKFAFR